MTKLALLRHGESIWNKENRFTGWTIDAIIHFAETLLGIRLKNVKKYRYNSLCPFHADTKENLMVYVNKKDEVRFHCFGACKGDWDIYDVIVLRKKCRFRQAQQVWAEHLVVKDFKSYELALWHRQGQAVYPEVPDDHTGEGYL